MTESEPPERNDATRHLGTPLIRSGDQGMLVRESARGLGNAAVWAVRSVAWTLAKLGLRTR